MSDMHGNMPPSRFPLRRPSFFLLSNGPRPAPQHYRQQIDYHRHARLLEPYGYHLSCQYGGHSSSPSPLMQRFSTVEREGKEELQNRVRQESFPTNTLHLMLTVATSAPIIHLKGGI